MPTLLSDQIIMALGAIIILAAIFSGFWSYITYKNSPDTTLVNSGVSDITLRPADLILFTILILFYGTKALSAGISPETNEVTFSSLLFNCGIQIIILSIVTFRLVSLKKTKDLNLKNIKFSTIIGYPLLAYISIVCISIILEQFNYSKLISELTGAPLEQIAVSTLRETDSLSTIVTLAISAGLIAPVTEEFLFRGYIYPILKKSLGMKLAMVLSALLFGIVHASLVPLLPLTILGLLFAILYEKCNTIWAPIMAHAIFNNITLLAILYAKNI